MTNQKGPEIRPFPVYLFITYEALQLTVSPFVMVHEILKPLKELLLTEVVVIVPLLSSVNEPKLLLQV